MQAIVALGLLLQAQPSAPAAPTAVEQTAPAQPAATQAAQNGEQRQVWVCRRETFTGTHQSRRVCRLVEEVEEVAERTGERMRRMRPTIRPAPGG